MRHGLWGVLVLLGCAAEPASKADLAGDETDVSLKTEALEGAACSTDADCDGWEFCDRLLCIPERPCPAAGQCRAQTRFTDAEGAPIPDASPAGVTRTLSVPRPEATVASLAIHATLRHTYRGDLQVVLRSPAGTEVVLHDRTGGAADDLTIAREVPELAGQAAAGDWQLVVRDLGRYDSGVLVSWDLSFVFAVAEPAPGGRNVWSSVALDSTESAHPYTNRFEQTWDLRPWTGGGSRARVHFERIDTENRYDFVEILDADTGAVLDSFTGRYADLTTREYDTSALQVRLRTDASITRWGFRADRVDVFGAGCSSDADCAGGQVCDSSIVCIRAPCFSQCVTRGGGEGAACASSSDCDEALYCGTDGTCRRDSTCGATADCTQDGNAWIHILCVGAPYCSEAGTCGWQCGGPIPVCTDGETRNDGCNACSCSGGLWRCTERYCPSVANEGEACGSGTVCAEGLVCDRGAAEGAVCGDDRPGTCLTPEQRYCRMAYLPVCTCSGQTFDNQCSRQAQGDWAHDGRCELSLAIPDASTTGISQTIVVSSPPGATRARVSVEIDHTWRGDLVVTVGAPDGSQHVLTNREGGSADDFDWTGTIDLGARSALGPWTLRVSDHARADVGVLRFFNVIAEASASRVGQACGSRGLAPCAAGELCQYEPADICGWADAAGTCQLVPEVCTRELRPVCGCDGQTYSNACTAHASGTSVHHEGGC